LIILENEEGVTEEGLRLAKILIGAITS
jgi:hypothetical protein